MPVAKEKGSVTFTVPGASGSYAPERWTCGETGASQAHDGFQGVTALVTTTVTGITVELWLRRSGAAVPFIDSDYTYTGKSIGATGSETWALAGVPGAQLRVKSGGTSGSAVVSGWAF